ncbi:MAG: DUF1285 domain-containing protein [Archangium sp.]|nr:DUF1285 domain-containing protein [Archangium sp.]
MAVTPRWHTREDSGIALDRDVAWFHDGERIEHPNIIEAFNRGLRVDDDGRYRLEFGNDWCFVTVARAAFRVVAVDVSEGDRLSLRLSDRTAEWLDPATLQLDGEVLEAKVKQGRAWARFSRDAQVQLAEFLEPAADRMVLHVGAHQWPTPLSA